MVADDGTITSCERLIRVTELAGSSIGECSNGNHEEQSEAKQQQEDRQHPQRRDAGSDAGVGRTTQESRQESRQAGGAEERHIRGDHQSMVAGSRTGCGSIGEAVPLDCGLIVPRLDCRLVEC